MMTDTQTITASSEDVFSDKMDSKGSFSLDIFGPDGELKDQFSWGNLITQVGDQYYADRAASIGSIAAITGMRLGTGTTATAKTGAGAALITYLTASNKALDSTVASSLSGAYRRLTYICTWAAGVATGSPTEVVLVNDTIATNATSTAANTIARIVLSSPPAKGALDTWVGTWNHDFLGA